MCKAFHGMRHRRSTEPRWPLAWCVGYTNHVTTISIHFTLALKSPMNTLLYIEAEKKNSTRCSMGMKCYFVVLRNSLFWISLCRGLTIYCFPMLWKYWGIYRGDPRQGGSLWCWVLVASEKKKNITWLCTSPLSPSRHLEFPLLCTRCSRLFVGFVLVPKKYICYKSISLTLATTHFHRHCVKRQNISPHNTNRTYVYTPFASASAMM